MFKRFTSSPSNRIIVRPFSLQRTLRRHQSHNALRGNADSVGESSVIIENFQKQTLFAFDTFRRLIKFSVIGILAVGVTSWTAFEGVHMWVENFALAPETDQDACKWEWDLESEKWSGDTSGGTDSVLGFRGRHAVRSAWMAQHWGTGDGANVIGSNAFGGKGAGGLNVVEARLEFAQDFLAMAIAISEKKITEGKCGVQTLSALLSRHASVLERMGSPEALFESRSQLERLWANQSAKGIEAARTALKLGDINCRLGDSQDALAWWARAIQITQAQQKTESIPAIPEKPPSSPLAQRVLTSTLVSLSAYYATSGNLWQAQSTEEAALHLLRSITPPSTTVSPPQALHYLYLLHRSSLLSIHLAEVLYALQNPRSSSIQSLTNAAKSSERVALALTGLSSIEISTSVETKAPHPPSPKTPLLPAYSKSQSMSAPASSLLRDSRRTAAEAWNLLGILTEEKAPETALGYYERALNWAGIPVNESSTGEASEGILEADRKVIWANYVRTRNQVHKGN